jgi:hypothetical protein
LLGQECQDLVKVGWSVGLSLEETEQLNLLAKKSELLGRLGGVQRDLLTLSEVRLYLEHAKACELTNEHPLLEVLRGKEVVGEEWEKKRISFSNPRSKISGAWMSSPGYLMAIL